MRRFIAGVKLKTNFYFSHILKSYPDSLMIRKLATKKISLRFSFCRKDVQANYSVIVEQKNAKHQTNIQQTA